MKTILNKIKLFFQELHKSERDEWLKEANIKAKLELDIFETKMKSQNRFAIIDSYTRLWTNIISVLDKKTGIYYQELFLPKIDKIIDELSLPL